MSPINPFGFFLATLAVWRCVIFIRQDVFIEGTRRRVFRFLDRKDTFIRGKLAYFIDCPWCLGIWFSGILVAIYATWVGELNWYEGIVTWLAIATVTAIFDQLADKL